jgi:uncharacterized protein YjiK
MTQLPMCAWLVVILVSATACDSQQRQTTPGLDSTELGEREARFARAITHTDSADPEAPIARWLLPPELDEISGLALTADGRLLAHGDQRGQVFEIDYRRGVVVKQFSLGKPTVHADFEGITVVGDTVVLLASDGTLYVFREGTNGARVDYAMHDTKLGHECEFEGVAFDAALHALLLACKNVRIKSLEDALVIFRWKLGAGKGPRLSRLTVPLRGIIGSTGWDGLHPSDITIDPLNGNYLIIASREEALVEITPAGNVIFARRVPGDHYQPEGVAITEDSILIISDEKSLGASEEHKHRGGKDETGVITLYRWPLARAPRETP